MKTTNELARSLGISRQTLYNVCKKMDISLDELTTKRRGKERIFDDEAEKKVRNILENNGTKTVNVFDKLDKVQAELDDARLTIEEKEKEIREIKRELENKEREQAEADARIREQADQLDKLRAEADALREDNKILIRTNATNALTIQKYQEREQMRLADGGEDRRGGWIRRAVRRITGRTEEKKE